MLQAALQDVPSEPDEEPVAAIAVPLAPGTTHVVWQLAAFALHDIMQLVAVEVTFDVWGVIGVNVCCAEAVMETADKNAIANANTIAARCMIASISLGRQVEADRLSGVYPYQNRPRLVLIAQRLSYRTKPEYMTKRAAPPTTELIKSIPSTSSKSIAGLDPRSA